MVSSERTYSAWTNRVSRRAHLHSSDGDEIFREFSKFGVVMAVQVRFSEGPYLQPAARVHDEIAPKVVEHDGVSFVVPFRVFRPQPSEWFAVENPYFSVWTVIIAPASTSCIILYLGFESTPSSRIFTSIHRIPVALQMAMS